MKLARPDVFHPRIVLAGCPALLTGDPDDDGLVAALRSRGLFARWLSWDDPETARADLVILRAPGDHAQRLDEFLRWTTTVRHLLNPPAAVAWNADRRYLLDLAGRGVPIASTAVPAAPGTALVCAQALVGVVQFYTGVPAALVACHVAGAAACTAATAALWASMRQRSEPEPLER